jgi:putative effector of murein hydrolase
MMFQFIGEALGTSRAFHSLGRPRHVPILVLAACFLWATDIACRRRSTGVAAHGIGTARIPAANELGGTFAGLGMGLRGILTSAFLPMLARLIWR